MREKSYTDDDVSKAVKACFSKAAAIKKLGLIPAGGNYNTLNNAIKRLNLDVSHFTGQGYLKDRKHDWAKKIPLEKILVENSTYNNNTNLKKRLFEKGLLKNKCQICGIRPEWQGKPLVLRLDHINGTNNDNRIENLRMVCPHCDSQLDTFTGRNIKKKKQNLHRCR